MHEKNTMRRLCKVEHALSWFHGNMNKVNSAFCIVEVEHTTLKKGFAESKLISKHSFKNLQEAMLRELELQKQCRTL